MPVKDEYRKKLIDELIQQSAEIDLLVIKLRQSTINSNLKNIEELEDLRAKQFITTNKLHDLEIASSNSWENIGDGGWKLIFSWARAWEIFTFNRAH